MYRATFTSVMSWATARQSTRGVKIADLRIVAAVLEIPSQIGKLYVVAWKSFFGKVEEVRLLTCAPFFSRRSCAVYCEENNEALVPLYAEQPCSRTLVVESSLMMLYYGCSQIVPFWSRILPTNLNSMH